MRFSLATIVFETFELILCQMLSSQGKNAPSDPISSLFSAFSSLKVRPFFLSDNSIWSFPSVSSLSDYSIWRS